MFEKVLKFMPLLVILAGLLLFVSNVVFNLGTIVRVGYLNATGQIAHPQTYRFPTYDKLLHSFVKDGLVDYQALKKSALLNQSIDELEKVDPDALATDQERLCFWINSYNLTVLKLINDQYPILSVKKLGNLPSRRKFIVGGEDYSVQDIYFVKIHPFLKSNPKALFLVCGGAMGYPRILDHAVLPDRLAADSDFSAFQFCNNPRNVYFDDLSNSFLISRLFVENNDLFVPDYQSPHHFANLYLPPKKRVDVDMATMMKTYLKSFDWRLNDLALKTEDAKKAAK